LAWSAPRASSMAVVGCFDQGMRLMTCVARLEKV
jgi:hypothetical protein